MKKRKLFYAVIFAFLASASLAFASLASAKIGVGVGLGKIQIDEKLSPGGIYKLPSLPVLNTGDEEGDYEVEVTYLSEQPELRPETSWFTFNPKSFPLSAGQSQLVEVTLTLPVGTRPGDYFAFLEAHPTAKKEGVTIGVAAATKLNFTVKPSGVLGAAIERIRSLLETTRPGSYIALGAIGLIILIVLGSRYLKVSIGLKKEEPKKEGEV